MGEIGLSTPSKYFCDGIESMTNKSIVSLTWFFPFLGSWSPLGNLPFIIISVVPLNEVSLDILLQVPLLDQTLYLLIEMIVVLSMVSHKFLELAPTTRLRPYNIYFWR